MSQLRSYIHMSATAFHSTRTIVAVHSPTSNFFILIAALSLPDLTEPYFAMVLPQPGV